MNFITMALLSLLLIFIGLSLSKKQFLDREKSRPFECGFNPKSLPRASISLRFFLVALVFLVFDVEIVLIFPAVSALFSLSNVSRLILLLVFMLVLIVGLYHEINQGVLN